MFEGEWTLVCTGMSKEKAKEMVEDFWGSLMWGIEDDGVIRTYPSTRQICSLTREQTKVEVEGRSQK